MSTVRRLFDDPKNSETTPEGRRIQVCCEHGEPYWDTYRIYDDRDYWLVDRNMTAHKQSDPLKVLDLTGESDALVNRIVNYDSRGNPIYGTNEKGYAWVEGPNSGYRPEFCSPAEWMEWQGLKFIPRPGVASNLPNPPQWIRMPGLTRKVLWGKGQGDWGTYDWTFLWCKKCETALERGWSNTLTALPIIARGIAMIASNIPVWGTAISFIINTTVSLAEGKPVDQALLDGIGGSLPGQPTSGIAFNAGVAIARGERIDHIVIDSLPIAPEVKDVLKTASDIIYGIASGENVSEVVYEAIYDRMPPNAQKAMGYAKRIINGENVPEMVLNEAEQAVVDKVRQAASNVIDRGAKLGNLEDAKAEAESLRNQYAAEVGYQAALSMLSTEERDAITTGLIGGNAMKPPQFVGTFGSIPEKNVAVNETYAQKGQRLIDEGATYRFKKVSDILAGSTFTVTINDFDSVNSRWQLVTRTYKITDAWRRGFLVAFGLCQGMSQPGPGQLAVYQTMAEAGGRDGFDAGQAVQYDRTLHGDSGLLSTDVVLSESDSKRKARAALFSVDPEPTPKAPDYLKNVSIPTEFTEDGARAAESKKATERAIWVRHYLTLNEMLGDSGGMTG